MEISLNRGLVQQFLVWKLMILASFFCTINPKKAGGVDLTPPCGFSKNMFFRVRVKSCFLVTFNIIISHNFPENVIKNTQLVQKI